MLQFRKGKPIRIHPRFAKHLTPEEKAELQASVDEMNEAMSSCGDIKKGSSLEDCRPILDKGLTALCKLASIAQQNMSPEHPLYGVELTRDSSGFLRLRRKSKCVS